MSKARTERREEQRRNLKKLNWRKVKMLLGIKRNLSFAQRITVINRAAEKGYIRYSRTGVMA